MSSADYIFGQDFGFSVDPTTLIKVAVDRDRRTMWVKTMYTKPGLSTKEIGET